MRPNAVLLLPLPLLLACGTTTGPEASTVAMLSVDGVTFTSGGDTSPGRVRGAQIGVVEEYIYCSDVILADDPEPCPEPAPETRIWSNALPVGTPVFEVRGFDPARFVGVVAGEGPLELARSLGQSQVGEELFLDPGESATVQDLTIRFVEVPEDSRCPLGVTCVWEGNATVALETVYQGVEMPVALNTVSGSRSAVVGPYTIDLLRLDPYPDQQTLNGIPAEWYRVTLQVVMTPSGG